MSERGVRGIPTATNVDHAGYTVPDIDEAITFFTEVLGCDLLYRAGPYRDAESDSMRRHLNIHPRTSVHLALLRCGPAQNIELVEMTSPEQDTTPPKVSDVGGRHLAFHVGDMAAAVAYMNAQEGVRVLETIIHEDDGGPETGIKTTYFTTPWGMYMELISRPPKGEGTNDGVFGPLPSWESRPL